MSNAIKQIEQAKADDKPTVTLFMHDAELLLRVVRAAKEIAHPRRAFQIAAGPSMEVVSTIDLDALDIALTALESSKP